MGRQPPRCSRCEVDTFPTHLVPPTLYILCIGALVCAWSDRIVLLHRIFSSERGPEGKRSFIATTLEGFWKRYRDMLPQHRHCYEIIRQGYPCHLYFGVLNTCTFSAAPLYKDNVKLYHLYFGASRTCTFSAAPLHKSIPRVGQEVCVAKRPFDQELL